MNANLTCRLMFAWLLMSLVSRRAWWCRFARRVRRRVLLVLSWLLLRVSVCRRKFRSLFTCRTVRVRRSWLTLLSRVLCRPVRCLLSRRTRLILCRAWRTSWLVRPRCVLMLTTMTRLRRWVMLRITLLCLFRFFARRVCMVRLRLLTRRRRRMARVVRLTWLIVVIRLLLRANRLLLLKTMKALSLCLFSMVLVRLLFIKSNLASGLFWRGELSHSVHSMTVSMVMLMVLLALLAMAISPGLTAETTLRLVIGLPS